MANLTTHGANALLDGTAFPQTLYIKAHTGDPTAAATGNPATESSRAALTMGAAAAGAAENDAIVEWVGVATGETWSHWSAWDHVSAGDPWLVGTVKQSGVDAPLDVEAGNTVRIGIGNFDISLPIWS